MKTKIIMVVALLVLSGCTLVDPVISEYKNEVFVMMGISLEGKTGNEDSKNMGFYYPGDMAFNHGGDDSQYVFENQPFTDTNRNPFIFTDRDTASITEKHDLFFYLNKTDISYVKPQFYAMYRNFELGTIRKDIIEHATFSYVGLTPYLGFTHYLHVAKSGFSNSEARIDVSYSFIEAPIFVSITLKEYDANNNIINEIDGSNLSDYLLVGDRVDISAKYIDVEGENREIFKSIKHETIDSGCYMGEDNECDYKDTFTYFVNGDGVFAKRMRIDFRN